MLVLESFTYEKDQSWLVEKLQAFQRSRSPSCWLQEVLPGPAPRLCALSSAWLLSACDPRLSHGLWLSHWCLCYPNLWPRSRPWFCFNCMDCALECCPCFLSLSTLVLFLAWLCTLSSVPISCTSPFCYVTNIKLFSKPQQIRLYKFVKEPDITGTLIAVRNDG